MPAAAGGITYAAGFMLAIAALHIAGIALGYLVGKVNERQGAIVTRWAGSLAAVAGIGLLAGLI
jgi:urease accessory protein